MTEMHNFTFIIIIIIKQQVDDIALVLQQNRLRWYGHVLRKDDDDWVKKCMEHEVEGSRPRGRPKTWKEVVREHCQACPAGNIIPSPRKLHTEFRGVNSALTGVSCWCHGINTELSLYFH